MLAAGEKTRTKCSLKNSVFPECALKAYFHGRAAAKILEIAFYVVRCIAQTYS